MKNRNPFEHSYFIGYINQVTPQYVNVHFPSSTLLKSYTFEGENLNGGLVGNFVVIEGERFGFLGKILELALPEKERYELSERSFNTKDFHPTGKIEILLSFDLFEPQKIDKGLNSLPVIGAKVFVCSTEFIKDYFKNFGVKEKNKNNAPVIDLGTLTYDKQAKVQISQQGLFGRHCAVVGTTGGGKSFTTSKLVEGLCNNNSKSILIDATGEYAVHDNKSYSDNSLILIENSFFPYNRLTVSDLFVLFRPSGQVQQPILLEAIKSLKIVYCLIRDKQNYQVVEEGENVYRFKVKITSSVIEDVLIRNGCYIKQGQSTKAYKYCYYKYVSEIEDNETVNFDILNLSKQIRNECFYDNGDRWSENQDARNYGNSTSLIMRVNNVLSDEGFSKLFGFKNPSGLNVVDTLNSFIDADGEKSLLRIGFEKVPFNFQAREIMANAIGKYLLKNARESAFQESPLVLFVDEAHQFLNKKVKDEYFESTDLSAFDSIAKECRKYGLFLCITTQMPRDIPIGTLSQIGTFIVHRLINHWDKEAIANASSSGNKNTLSFLPVLGAGEAILMGVDFPMSVMLKIDKPNTEPNSGTPQFTL